MYVNMRTDADSGCLTQMLTASLRTISSSTGRDNKHPRQCLLEAHSAHNEKCWMACIPHLVDPLEKPAMESSVLSPETGQSVRMPRDRHKATPPRNRSARRDTPQQLCTIQSTAEGAAHWHVVRLPLPTRTTRFGRTSLPAWTGSKEIRPPHWHALLWVLHTKKNVNPRRVRGAPGR